MNQQELNTLREFVKNNIQRYASDYRYKFPKETATDPNIRVYRTTGRGSHVYHRNPKCHFLKLADNVNRPRLGAMLAAKFRRHC